MCCLCKLTWQIIKFFCSSINLSWLQVVCNLFYFKLRLLVASRIDYCNAVLPDLLRKRRPTNCNECWTPQLVWSVVPISSTKACRDSSLPSYIGWMFLSKSCTNSASWCSTACMVKRLSTSRNCANQSQVSHHGNISHPPPDSSWTYRATSSGPMAGRQAFRVAGLSVWNSLPDSLRNPLIGGNSFRQFLKTFLFATYTDGFSALEVSRRCAI